MARFSSASVEPNAVAHRKPVLAIGRTPSPASSSLKPNSTDRESPDPAPGAGQAPSPR